MTDPQPPDDAAAVDDLAAAANPAARTAGEEDHSDPWRFAGDDAAPPTDPARG